MIIVKLSGGLGNQLFQYSFGRYLSLKHKTELKFDTQLNSSASDFTPRLLGLSNYNINLCFASKKEINRYKIYSSQYFSRIERKLIQIFPFLNNKYFVEEPFEILDKDLFVDDCYYDGYWQSENYFNSVGHIIRSDLQLKLDLDDKNSCIAEEISKSLSISIHIRRGDYVSVNSNSKIYSSCTLQYYQKAIEFFNLQFENPMFYIFSDDIDWARENFYGNNFKIIDINQGDPHADLFLMSICKHNIIANSSFSWWGAWLNRNKNKIVISPQKWYSDKIMNDKAVFSLIPENWILI